MIRNNIISIIYHAFTRILYFFSMIFIGFNSSLPRTDEERLAREAFRDFKSWTTFFVIIILYFILGLFLKSYKSKLKNFLSVSLISFIGLLFIALSLPSIQSTINLNFNQYFLLLAPLDIPSMGITKLTTGAWDLIFRIVSIFMPSFIIWIGVEVKKKVAEEINSIPNKQIF